ncbi:hypothetical protein [Pseudonocardia lacus]|uniref:hypothetical protein n=1 Tax=Pseudonocardia lacus TaxID=2835865 RepID=UPI001BDCAAB7|nr:hypothetical protein [Pseudonocardia lacus]
MVGIAMVTALGGAVAAAVLLVVARPADARRTVRLAAAAIVVLTAGLLTPFAVQDSGPAAIYLLGVPVVAAVVPPLARRTAVDLLAAAAIGGWGLLLGLGIGGAFLPPALLLLAAPALAPPSRTTLS